MKHLLLAAAVVAAGCNSDIDEPWVLDHDRIIAVRAEPPGIEPGEVSTLSMFVGYETLPAEVKKPDFAQVVSPMSLASTVSFDGTNWIVTAPDEATLAAARTELKIAADKPVPLVVGLAVAWPYPVMSPDPNGFAATKTVWLGEERVNPPINGLTTDGAPAPAGGTALVISATKDVKTRLTVEADDTVDIVNWLTSCGEMHDFDLATSAYITVGEEDRREGQLAIVLRDPLGGVSWQLWPITAQ